MTWAHSPSLRWGGPPQTRPVQYARETRGVEIGVSAMQQTAIVPHQHIAGVPFVTVDEPFLDRVRGQHVEQRAAFLHWAAFDVGCMLPHEQGFFAGFGECSRQRMSQRRGVGDFLRRGL